MHASLRLRLCVQLVQLKRQMASAWEELEALMVRGFSQIKQLKPYARKPYTTYVLYGVMSFPFLLLGVPLLLAFGECFFKPCTVQGEGQASCRFAMLMLHQHRGHTPLCGVLVAVCGERMRPLKV